ncbi:TATA box-binding protein-associated factor, RNA polymerase I, subunit C isoform X2 [Boleophthalmus pectinirostris]|uniref:TATA box-binding protein-associated factor, RNA polymerase I, subunit C isoform X2 n=1 Tax=Boleophthalmus pectinirostris TaxID=150288 RepID=UPI002432D723|nr:TATA box-binding protein-associated factor, RNA polymerase I, subunit C isoform X2 [Boleophthalmus pectinirostris]
MDTEFPSVLFPSFYNNEPPESELGHCAGSWGSYGQLRIHEGQSFRTQHTAAGESWRHTEPVPVPLLAPKPALFWSSKPADPLDFSKHLQNFFMDHPSDAFSPMASILGETMDFSRRPHKRAQQTQAPISVWGATDYMDKLKPPNCPTSPWNARMDAYSRLLSDVVHSVPVELLGSLVHEELSQQSRDALFCETNSGGALDLIPLTPSTQHTPLSGCLAYSPNGLDKLHFQEVALEPHAVVCSDEVSSFLLKGPIQQITSTSLCGHSCVAVRSLYHCGVWRLTSAQQPYLLQPHLLQALSTTEALSCTSLSPHVVGELLVAGESGAAHLWRLGHGMQQVRTEDSNLYFNSQSSWRWCEFSAHPRVMLYADRTGVELTDIRVQPSSCHTLFRISQTAECRSGERLLLCRYLSTVHSFHHLVCTQYSAYIMDERFPCVPMLKCDHMMEAPPVFCQVLPSSDASTGGVTKILLGSQRSQEVTMLQYSGGGAEACVSHGPVQALLRPRDSVQHLPTQLPHRTEVSQDRLAHAASGLAAVHLKRSESSESFCVFHLLQTGDVFYQILERDRSAETRADVSCTRAEEPEQPEPEQRGPAAEPPLSSHSLSIWRQWLQRLARRQEAKKSKPAHVMVKGALRIPQSQNADRATGKRGQRGVSRSIQQQSLSAYSVPTENIVPLPEEVQPEEWGDNLSVRLTAAWDSEQGWQAWWSEHLMVNRAEKTQALRRKRRQEKDAKRVSGLTLLSLSGSFTSSISYQSELSDLSDWAWSDSRGIGSQSEDSPGDNLEKQRLPVAVADQSPQPSTSELHRPVESSKDSSRDAFSWPHTFSQISSQRSPHTSSQTSSQRPLHTTSQHPLHTLSQTSSQCLPHTSSQTSSQRPLHTTSQASSQRLPHTPSQTFSQTFSQTSLSSQPKKKSRMGF